MTPRAAAEGPRGGDDVPELDLQRLRSPELAPQQTGVVYPFGTLEQHGAHLPLATDFMITDAVAHRAGARVDGVVVAPTLPYGCSEHHLGVAGTHSISMEALGRIVRDLLRSARVSGFAWALLLNGHGGNRGVLETAAAEATAEARSAGEDALEVAVCHYWNLVDRAVIGAERDGGVGSMSHAGEFETSIILALEPTLVGAIDEAADFVNDDPLLRNDLFRTARASRAGRWADLETGGGVRGRPSLASREKGERLLEAAAEGVAEVLRRLATGTWSR